MNTVPRLLWFPEQNISLLSLESDSVRIILFVYKQYYPPTCHLNPFFFLSVENLLFLLHHLDIYFACLSICLFVSNKRQNSWTDRVQILYGTSRKVHEWSKLKIILQQNSIFINFWNSTKYFDKSANFIFVFWFTM